jgi:hypothetical protein
MRIGIFANRPDCRAVCAAVGRAIRRAATAPKYIICDRDSIFDCDRFRRWVKRQGIQAPRYGAVGKHGSIAVVERLIRTDEILARKSRWTSTPLRITWPFCRFFSGQPTAQVASAAVGV